MKERRFLQRYKLVTRMDKNKLISDNYDKIYNLAKRYAYDYGLKFDAFEDLQKAGYESLLEQCEQFNETSDASFWTYAYKGVRAKMMSEVQFLLHTVSIPMHLNKQLAEVAKIRAANGTKNSDELADIVSREMDVSIYKAEELLILSKKKKIELDAISDDEDNLSNILPADNSANPEYILYDELVKRTADIEVAIKKCLNARQTEYVKLHFGIGCKPHTYEEIGEEFCVKASAVEKGVHAALKTLRDELEDEG